MNQMTSINDQKTENQKQSIKAKQNESNGIGSVGFVFALISIFIAWITFLGWIIWLLGFSLSWAGIYKKAGQFINVNRGFGFLAFPGRVGIWPEISVITLKKGVNNT